MSEASRSIIMQMFALALVAVAYCSPPVRAEDKAASVAVLDFAGDETTAALAGEELSRAIKADKRLELLDRDLARMAARGIGHAASLNLSRSEARDLGRSIGCHYYFAGRAETLRRSSSAHNVYYETYAAVFLVSTRTGRLALFDFVSAEADEPEAARAALRRLTAGNKARYIAALFRAQDAEIAAAHAEQRGDVTQGEEDSPVIDFSQEEESTTAELRPPHPYRRLRPAYTDQAARAGVEATVDASVIVGANGDIVDVEIERWAGFGLDEAVVETIRRLHFRPATLTRTGEGVRVRVLLRYNFKRPKPK